MSGSVANRILEAAREVQEFCSSEGWSFCFIGAIAVLRWGEPRLTQDADLEVFTGVGDEQRYVDRLLQRFAARIEGARAFALQRRVMLLRAANGVPIDVSLGALEFEEQAAAGATVEELSAGIRLRVASPSSLIVFKVFADRPKDWSDVEGIIVRSGPSIDWQWVETQLRVLLELKGEPAPLERLVSLRTKLARD